MDTMKIRRENMVKKNIITAFLMFMMCLLVGVASSGASVFVQCPRDNIPPVSGAYDPVTNSWISADGTIVCIHLVATDGFVNMADKQTTDVPYGRIQYTFGFTNVTGLPNNTSDAILPATELGAELPAPTISVKQGQDVYITLTNRSFTIRPDLFDGHSLHWHGFPNAATVFDGEPMASFGVFPGSSFTYYYKVNDPGTYMYHCHVEATEHMQMGMLGNLYVRPLQDDNPGSCAGFAGFAYNDGDCTTGYHVSYPIQLTSFDPDFHDADMNIQPLPFAAMEDRYPMINGRGYPDTINPAILSNSYADSPSGGKPSQKMNSIISANSGQRILLRISSLATIRFYTLISPSIPMKVVGKDTRLLRATFGAPPPNLYYNTNSVTLGGGQSVDAIIDTTGVPAGTYYLYTSNLNELNNDKEDFGGMMTEIRIN
jgi:FtsP/CotA-like multicopper oxidase with cupredoxin domain